MNRIPAIMAVLLVAATAGYFVTGSQQSYSIDYSSDRGFSTGNVSTPVTEPHVSQERVSFTGRIEVDDSCTEVKRSSQREGNNIVVEIDTYSTGNCSEPDQNLYKTYRMEINSNQPFRLEVRHDGNEVRAFRTPGYEP